MDRKLGKNARHGHTVLGRNTGTYTSWCCMKRRCLNKNNQSYPYYGGRGITVCERWMRFDNFLEDMGERPNGMCIERIKNDLGYYKENCRWASQKEQCRNKRGNVLIEHGGRTMVVKDWANESGICKDTITHRVRNLKWEPELAFSTPSYKNNNTNSHILTYNGESMSISEWSRKTGIGYQAIWQRLVKLKWSVEKSLTTPQRVLRVRMKLKSNK